MSFLSPMKQHPLLWLSFIYVVVLLANGTAITDIGDFIRISSDPTHMLASIDRQFLYSSPLNFFIAALLHLDTVFGFFFIHAVEIIAMLGCVAYAVGKKIDGLEKQILYITLLSLTPLWLVSFKWIGKTDPLLIGLLFLSWAQPGYWRILTSTIMILAHREIGSLMVLSLWFLEDRKDPNLIVGLLAANALHFFYQYGILDHAPQTRMELMSNRTGLFFEAFSRMPALYILTMFSWYWIVVLLNRPKAKELLVMSMALVLSLMNEDFTRDFILAALPALLFHLERVVRVSENAKLRKLWPLAPLQIQVAALGMVYMPANGILLWLGTII